MIKAPNQEWPQTKHGIALPNFLVLVWERSCRRKNVLAIVHTKAPLRELLAFARTAEHAALGFLSTTSTFRVMIFFENNVIFTFNRVVGDLGLKESSLYFFYVHLEENGHFRTNPETNFSKKIFFGSPSCASN